MREVDVVVLGSGISGCVAAYLFALQGRRVVLLSKEEGTQAHLPESWFVSLPSNLASIGLESAFLPHPKVLFSSIDGKASVEISMRSQEPVWVDRNRFDQILFYKAKECGVEVISNRTITHCCISSGLATIDEFITPLLIDATGKTAFLAQHLKLPMKERQLDDRVGFFTHFEFSSSISRTIKIIALPEGFLYILPISDRRVSVGCALSEGFLQDILKQISFLDNARQVLPILPVKNYQRTCLEPSGSCYRLVGDAAVFLDPFFCPGIDFALFSAACAVESADPDHYKNSLLHWLEQSTHSVYEQLERSQWRAILRCFADPHIPFPIPMMLTQTFGQVVRPALSLKEGIQLARESYANH